MNQIREVDDKGWAYIPLPDGREAAIEMLFLGTARLHVGKPRAMGYEDSW